MRKLVWSWIAAALVAIPAHAATPLFVPGLAKAAEAQPKSVRSVAQPVSLNAAGLAPLKPGAELELTLPNGSRHALILDQVTDHGQGIKSYVAYDRDGDPRRKLRTIVTTGPDGTFGTVQTKLGEFSLVPGRGHDWLVEAKAESRFHEAPDLAADAVQVPRVRPKAAPAPTPLMQADFAQAVSGTTTPQSTKAVAAPSAVYIDVLFVYTKAYSAALPGSQLATRLAQLVATANTAYADSGVGIIVRNAGTLLADYPDTGSDNQALNDATYATNPAFASVAQVRDMVGADLVSVLRYAPDGLNGSGVAWVPSHAITADDAYSMFSVVTGCWQGCDWLWAHELGHNMGNAHDRATIAWEVSALKQGESRGSFDYSYGFYTCDGAYDNAALSCSAFGGGCTGAEPQCRVANASRNYTDIMGYFHQSTRVLQFSNPDLQCADSGLPCGLPDGYMDGGTRLASANAALSMNNNRIALSALRSVRPAQGQASTTTTVESSGNPARVGSSVAFTAKVVAPVNGAQTGVGEGTVQFLQNGTAIPGCESVALSAGAARCAATFGAGTFTVTASYNGTATYPASAGTLVQSMVAVPALAGTPPRRADFNADGRADLAWAHDSGVQGAWLMAGDTVAAAAAIAAPDKTSLRALADFDGDGRTDALWRSADGSYWITLLDGTTVRSTVKVFTAVDGWEVVAVADFNGDGRADLLWNAADGRFGMWLMNGTSAQAFPPVPVPRDARAMLAADFNGDGQSDLMWQLSDGSVGVTMMSGGTVGSLATVMGGGTGFTPVAAGDFDGDRRADVLLAHADGRVVGWRMTGAQVAQSVTLLDAGTGWSIAGTADLDGDARADVLWTHAGDGMLGGWLMNGLAVKQAGGFPGTSGTGWRIASVGDFDGNGTADLVLALPTGEHAIWTLQGLAVVRSKSVLGPGTGWHVAP